jgi:hypothetical protein
MLRWFRQFGPGQRSDPVDIERLLRLEAAEARVAPSAGLRRRTLAALREATLHPAAGPSRPGPRAFTYVAACAGLVLLASAAVLHLAAPSGDPAAPAGPRQVTGSLNVLTSGAGRFESPLKKEVRLLVADARQARDYLLSRLPRRLGTDG